MIFFILFFEIPPNSHRFRIHWEVPPNSHRFQHRIDLSNQIRTHFELDPDAFRIDLRIPNRFERSKRSHFKSIWISISNKGSFRSDFGSILQCRRIRRIWFFGFFFCASPGLGQNHLRRASALEPRIKSKSASNAILSKKSPHVWCTNGQWRRNRNGTPVDVMKNCNNFLGLFFTFLRCESRIEMVRRRDRNGRRDLDPNKSAERRAGE